MSIRLLNFPGRNVPVVSTSLLDRFIQSLVHLVRLALSVSPKVSLACFFLFFFVGLYVNSCCIESG